MYKPKYLEKEKWEKGELEANIYEEALIEARKQEARQKTARHFIKAEGMPWETCREGKLKHIVNDKMNVAITSLDVYMQEIQPGSRSGKHRHMSEEVFYVLEGKGYDMHFDPDIQVGETTTWATQKEGKKFEWEAGDLVYIPPMVAHQHFNVDSKQRARIIIANQRIVKHMGCRTFEQLEDAPDYEP